MIYLKKYKLAYIPVPKNACTTTKTFFVSIAKQKRI
tara:strand:- start:2324 stop:2431 length:108 start_codon:yes stop_codon:yes gene_type:complete